MWWWIVGCGDGGLPPRIEALGGGAGYWPPNGPTAVEGAIAAGFDGLVLGVVLTSDRVPVLAGSPWLDPDRCIGPDGGLLDPVLVRHRTAAELEDGFRCGGEPDPAHPNALVVAEPLMTFDALLDALHAAPSEMLVRLDLYREDEIVPRPDVFATQILDRWFAEDLPQALAVSSADPDVLFAFDRHGRAIGLDVPTHLTFPVTADTQTVLAVEAERWANGLDYVVKAREAGADGLVVDRAVADRALVDAARDEGLEIAISTVDGPDALAQWSRPGRVDAVITNYPGDVP